MEINKIKKLEGKIFEKDELFKIISSYGFIFYEFQIPLLSYLRKLLKLSYSAKLIWENSVEKKIVLDIEILEDDCIFIKVNKIYL